MKSAIIIAVVISSFVLFGYDFNYDPKEKVWVEKTTINGEVVTDVYEHSYSTSSYAMWENKSGWGIWICGNTAYEDYCGIAIVDPDGSYDFRGGFNAQNSVTCTNFNYGARYSHQYNSYYTLEDPPPSPQYDINYTNEYWSVSGGTFYGVYTWSGFEQSNPVWRGNSGNGYGLQYGIRWNNNTSKWNLMVGGTINQSSNGTEYDQVVYFGTTRFTRYTNGVWNATSPIEVKGWKRHYIYGKEDGTIHDPSGKVAPWVQAASISATTRELSQIADAARVTASNNLARMYAVTNQVTTFTKKIFVQAQLYPDLTKLTNCWGRVVKEWTDGTNDHCWVYFSRELKTAPVMKREYKAQTFTNVVEGVWAVPSFTNQSVMVDGYAGCKELIYRRPDNFVMKNCFTQPYLKWGTQEAGFNFGQRVFTIDDVLPFTGSWTNSLGKIWKFNNGTLVGEPTDVQ